MAKPQGEGENLNGDNGRDTTEKGVLTCEKQREETRVTGSGAAGERKVARAPQISSPSDQEDGSDQIPSPSEQETRQWETVWGGEDHAESCRD